MLTFSKHSIPALATIFMFGCVGVGINFAPDSAGRLRVRSTTRDQVVQMLGKPESSKRIVDGDTKSTIEVYSYMRRSGATETWKYKDLILEYVTDTLNGFLYSNSYDSSSTDIEVTAIDKLKRNETTRDQIIAMFGPHCGEVIFPSNLVDPEESSEHTLDSTKSIASALSYRYVLYKRDGSRYRTLLLYLSAKGILMDTYYADNITE